MSVLRVQVIVPESRYDLITRRLDEVPDRRKLYTFISSRCDRVFLVKYLQHNSSILSGLCIVSTRLRYSPNVLLLSRLHKLGLLPEEIRGQFVEHAARLAIEVPEFDFLGVPTIRALFTEDEIAELLSMVRDDLLPYLRDLVSNWESDYSPQKDPDDHFEPLRDALFALVDELDDEDSRQQVEDALALIDESITALNLQYPSPDLLDDEYERFRGSFNSDREERSIFDDVDE